MTDYRSPAKTDGITEIPVTIEQPKEVSYYLVTDGVVWLTTSAHLTMEEQHRGRFEAYESARACLMRAGHRASRALHILRIDLTASVTDETFERLGALAPKVEGP